MRRAGITEGLAAAVVITLVVAAAYEAGVALRILGIGSEPGSGPAGEGFVVTAALLAFVVGAAICLTRAASAGRPGGVVWMLLAPAAVVFMIARFSAFDPYYAPTLRRASDGGLVSPWWVAGVATAGLVASALARARFRVVGMILTAVVMTLSALTALAARVGH